MTEQDGYRRPLAVVPFLAIPIFLAIGNQTMISVALPAVGADLGELNHLPWLVIGYMLALTVSGPVYGVLGDTYGRSLMLKTALLVYIAGTVLATLATDIRMLAVGRLVQGFGGGGLMSLSQAMIGDLVAPRERGAAQGWVASIGTTASTAGPVVGGILVAGLGWRALFAATIPLAVIALVVLWRLPQRQAGGAKNPFDLRGFIWLNLFAFALTAAVEMQKMPGRGAYALLAAGIALVCLVRLVRSQRISRNPMFPPGLFAIRDVAQASVIVTCHGAAIVSLTTLLPLFQAIQRGDSTLDVAFNMLALTAAFGVSGIITGNLITLTGRTALFPTLALPLAAGGMIALGLVGADLPRVALIGVYLWIGLFLGTVMSVTHTTVMNAAPADLRGRASGAITFFRSIGAVVGTATVSLILFAFAPDTVGGDVFSGKADPVAWAGAFRAAFLTVASFSLTAWVFAATTPARRIG